MDGPRVDRNKLYPLIEIIFLTIAAVFSGEIVVIDGKTLRRSHDKAANKQAIHMVSAWASNAHLVLGQRKVDEKSNEITAIPQLLQMLELSGCIVTIDAIGCQKEIAEKIIEKKTWKGLSAIGCARVTSTTGEKTTCDDRYHIVSSAMEARRFGEAVRGHWGIENNLHWSLDVSFCEDESRLRNGSTPYSFAVMRHIRMNLVKQETSLKRGTKGKRYRSVMDSDYRERVLFAGFAAVFTAFWLATLGLLGDTTVLDVVHEVAEVATGERTRRDAEDLFGGRVRVDEGFIGIHQSYPLDLALDDGPVVALARSQAENKVPV